ncbi:class I SAM-dependent methyltransferase [Blastopirellula retiformator]|uniref:Demethylrebeccamycin-D-glucose O-methyltransferase n=1 Tax=Blastopirellula retiformator TaxID=2527970 RepID=A0A5C5UW65_9BACT|nr:class I SAM-dependent methyltransferase [Blastopirellula retiformator]TWT30624.1 Demethylrebeccamycin-D-glucose O-methyltransferase [Blastopirellula retiformator]
MSNETAVTSPAPEDVTGEISRIPHIEPLFEDVEFVSEYSRLTKRYAGADYEPILKFALAELKQVEQPRVLELGPGPGWIGISLAKRRKDIRVTGIDISNTYVDIANENAAHEGVDDRVDFRKGDACSLDDFADGTLDAVISNQSFHYWEPPTAVLREVARVLKPNGVFCIGDDRRDLTFLASFIVLLTKWFLTASVRESWMRSLQGSFTAAEVKEIIERSELKHDAQIKLYPRMFFVQGRLKK